MDQQGGGSLYGLLGHPLGHSFSRAYFNNMFAREGIDAEYFNFDIPSIDMLPQVLAEHPNLRGLNVTIPYKQAVIPFLDDLSDEARAIGAVNVIRISPATRYPRGGESCISPEVSANLSPVGEESCISPEVDENLSPVGEESSISPEVDANGKEVLPSTGGVREGLSLSGRGREGLHLKGFNSDIIGFMDSIRPLLKPHHRRALVLGTGGASRAICRGLELLGLEWRYVTRTPKATPPASSVSGIQPASSMPATPPAAPVPATPPASSVSATPPAVPVPDTPPASSMPATPPIGSVPGGLSAGLLPPLTYSALSPALLAEYTVIVNCTPLGMFPNVDTAPPIAYAALSPRHLLYDLVYNPEETLFMRQGRRFGATVKGGLEMLHLQAIASWEFWNGKD